MIGQLLGSRYEISSILATGGMSQTYLARDNQRPGHPICVVKRLQPPSTESDQLQLARRLFNTEAEVLHQLGTHDQIPQLLAYFEEAGEFYLVQEFIEGTLLFDQLKTGQPWSESKVVQFLKDVLQLLGFVHAQGAIHRDIKPGNLIQRHDGNWVLLDFGAVKQVHLTQLQAGQDMSITVAIGTPGYLAPESICGKPRFSSDIFSLGIIGICALTGLPPDAVQDTDSTSWLDRCSNASDRLKDILERMTQLNFALRYTTAKQVLADLDQIESQASTVPETVLVPPTIPATVYLTQTLKRLLPEVQKIRKTRQLVGVGLCVGLSIGGLHQLARASQARARTQLESLAAAEQTADYDTCIETAQSIAPISSVYREAQTILGNCQLAQARQLTQNGQFRAAIASAHQVPRGVPAYEAAQTEIPVWSERILELATDQYRQGEIDTAIAMAEAIPNYSPTRSTARQTIRGWRREWQTDEERFQQAQRAFDRGEWANAIAATQDIASPYWQTQAASIVQQSNAYLQPAPRPAAPVAVSAPPAPQPAQFNPPPAQPQAVVPGGERVRSDVERQQEQERQQREWVRVQQEIEREQQQEQVRVQREQVRIRREQAREERERVRAQRNNRQNRNSTIEDRIVNEIENQFIRSVEDLFDD